MFHLKRISLMALAIAQMIALSIAIGSVGYFMDEMKKLAADGLTSYHRLVDMGIYGRHEFFLTAAAIGLLCSTISFIITILNRQENPKFAAQMVTLRALCSILILISASLLTKTEKTYAKQKVGGCKSLKASPSDARCGQLTVGVVFAFFSMVLFILDALIYISNLLEYPRMGFSNMDNNNAET
ncbi:uncharacterized protein LOC114517165 [Dendronephthya gigantea]|uniref:uncharacterized protein LOC114517165 n=1 Tax=Dendronephthya gigantea TaxID=151771 RepID=UPI00106ADEF6|nr:uncharacterized protein LOC114517165 [Dendronephthya gigantea]